jgi:hypothetical protein
VSDDDAGLSVEALAATAKALRVDATAATVIRALHDEGIEAVLLKGSALDFLYEGDRPRTYVDVDLLVDPAHHERAGRIICGLGYRSLTEGASPLEAASHATTFVTDDDRPAIDLHHTTFGVTVPSATAWEILSAATVPHRVGGCDTRALALPLRALHVALHFAQSGPGIVNPADDLDRALAKVDLETWREAATFADCLRATEALAAGLRGRPPAGTALADELGLPERVSLTLDLRRRTASSPAKAFATVLETPGIRHKAARLARFLVPSPAVIRILVPSAERGGLWLVAGYATRTWRSARKLPKAVPELLTAVRRRRRATG